MQALGIDTGGTFTDFVLYDGKSLKIHKCLSTPEQPEKAILQGIRELNIHPEDLIIIHGSTVATNATLENKGVRTVYITNYGLADTLSIGRQTRHSLYNLQPPRHNPPVEPELCIETGGRLGATGETIEPLSDEELRTLKKKVSSLAPQAVAINLLFSFLDDTFEKRIEASLPKDIFVSRSSFVLPQYKEYERGITTWLNASVGPIVERYIAQLSRQLPKTQLSIMQSSGGTISAEQAGTHAVHMLLSGPAGGLAGASFVASQCNKHRLLTFDMGGTSTDVSLIDGEPKLTSEAKINDYPVAIPMVDIHTIGAGGGSIAWIDAGGMLRVGPESAGAAPGPACYNKGGTLATVTDANLVLGRLLNSAFLGGGMTLNLAKAREAIASVANSLGLSIEETAEGIIRIANEHMAQALRVISIQRGLDPRLFTLVSFGGAGGLHVCALADALDMREAIVPVHAGVLSALGMLAAPRSRQLSKTIVGKIHTLNSKRIETEFDTLLSKGFQALEKEGIAREEISSNKTIDVRYAGQSYTVNIPWRGIEYIQEDFNLGHKKRYGHELALDIELVNLRLAIKGPTPKITLKTNAKSERTHSQKKRLYGISETVTIIDRDNLRPNTVYKGPALITETVSTTLITRNWQCTKDALGNLHLSRTHTHKIKQE